jgi:cell division protein ZapA (FtsZ GTPase activity inhibitor)
MSERAQTEQIDATPVTIYGQTYHLRGNGDPTYLEELASIVDTKMREISEATATADTLKVAILASLNIADEYFGASRVPATSRDADKAKRLARMVTLLDEALAG